MEPNHIAQIKQTFAEKTANLPALTPEQEKQILHEIIQERVTKPQIGSAAQGDEAGGTDAQMPPPRPAAHTPQVQSAILPEQQKIVDNLVTMAVQEDLYKATKLAYETKNPFLIDQYHDTLVNKFYELIKLQEPD